MNLEKGNTTASCVIKNYSNIMLVHSSFYQSKFECESFFCKQAAPIRHKSNQLYFVKKLRRLYHCQVENELQTLLFFIVGLVWPKLNHLPRYCTRSPPCRYQLNQTSQDYVSYLGYAMIRRYCCPCKISGGTSVVQAVSKVNSDADAHVLDSQTGVDSVRIIYCCNEFVDFTN